MDNILGLLKSLEKKSILTDVLCGNTLDDMLRRAGFEPGVRKIKEYINLTQPDFANTIINEKLKKCFATEDDVFNLPKIIIFLSCISETKSEAITKELTDIYNSFTDDSFIKKILKIVINKISKNIINTSEVTPVELEIFKKIKPQEWSKLISNKSESQQINPLYKVYKEEETLITMM